MKIVLLNSGGQESLLTAMMLTGRAGSKSIAQPGEHELHSLFINANQGSVVGAMEMSKRIAAKFCKTHYVTFISGQWQSNNVFGAPGIPYQTVIFHGLAAAYADRIGADGIASGIRRLPSGVNMDLFIRDMLAGMGLRVAPEVFLPVYNWEKASDIVLALQNEPLFPDTVTCNVSHPPCRVCPKCKLRARLTGDPLYIPEGG